MSGPGLSTLGEMVRRHDPDRFFTALLAPPARRETLFLLYAFNHELARANEVTREPIAALIRLQWWREVVEGAVRRHEVAEPLRLALGENRLDAAELLRMIEAREMETEPVETVTGFEAYVRDSAGALMVAAGRALGMPESAVGTVRLWGAAQGVAGVLRNVPALARQGRCLLPLDLLRQQGLELAAVVADPAAAGRVQDPLRQVAEPWLRQRVRVGSDWAAAVLPAVAARRFLLGGFTTRPVTDRLAVLTRHLRLRCGFRLVSA